jgi:hypothetical protein
MLVTVFIKTIKEEKFEVQVETESTVGDFKLALVERTGIPANEQRLVHSGRVLKDNLTIGSYGMLVMIRVSLSTSSSRVFVRSASELRGNFCFVRLAMMR